MGKQRPLSRREKDLMEALERSEQAINETKRRFAEIARAQKAMIERHQAQLKEMLATMRAKTKGR